MRSQLPCGGLIRGDAFLAQAAAVITFLERIGTFSYFIPTALKLMQAETVSATEPAMASQWMRLNLLRAASNLTGWLAALKAVTARLTDHHGARPARNVR